MGDDIDENIRLRKRFREMYLPDVKYHNYGSVANYAETMRNYVNECHRWYQYCYSMQMQQREHYINEWARSLQPQFTLTQNSQNQGYTEQQDSVVNFEPASIVRRVVAEGIDFLICFAVKLLFVLFLIEMNILDVDPFQKALEEDSDIVEFIMLTQELLPLEVICKIICAILEGLFMAVNIGPCRSGQTPGKWIVGIRVIAATSVVELAIPNQIAVQNPSEITFKQSFFRAMLKNLVVNSLFPLSTFAFNISATRSFYDALLKTVVVTC